MKLRLFSPGARWVWRHQPQIQSGRLLQDLLVLHCRPVDWETIFRDTLRMMALSPVTDNGGLRLENGAGHLSWRSDGWRTKISLRLEKLSPQKQTLIAAALAKAARYYQPEEEPCQKSPNPS